MRNLMIAGISTIALLATTAAFAEGRSIGKHSQDEIRTACNAAGGDLLGVSAGPLVLAAVAFGLLTNVFPALFMFPAMGFGAFGQSGPPGLLLMRTAIVNHLIFGLGLAWTMLAFGRVKA